MLKTRNTVSLRKEKLKGKSKRKLKKKDQYKESTKNFEDF